MGSDAWGCFGLLTPALTRLGAYSLIPSVSSTLCNKSNFVDCMKGGGEAGGAMRY